VAAALGPQQTQMGLLGQVQVPAPCFRGATDQQAAQVQGHLLAVQTRLFQAQEEAQEEGSLLLQRLDLQGAREEIVLDRGSAVALPPAAQLEATADLLQTSQQVFLPVAAQAEAVGLALPETPETVAMVGFTAALEGEEARLSITSATLVQAVQGRRAS
jgi:hypothetical protein